MRGQPSKLGRDYVKMWKLLFHVLLIFSSIYRCHLITVADSTKLCSKPLFLCILIDCGNFLKQHSLPELESSLLRTWSQLQTNAPCASTHCLAYNRENGRLLKSMEEWTLSPDGLLLSSFPIEKDTRNFVRRFIPGAIFSQVLPTPFKSKPKLALYSTSVLEKLLDMDPSEVILSEDFIAFVSGSSVLPGFVPLAHRYGGHQFGYWAEQLGDGRAHLLGEYVNYQGQRLELQLKGSGKTPYSRDGDGRAVVRSSVREFLCSEAMHYLGIPTSRAATLSISDDLATRDMFYNGDLRREKTAVVLRLAPSWFRIGSFEILAATGEVENLRLLADFVIEHYFRSIDISDPDKYVSFLYEFSFETARLMALWQSVGFTHGVMNTDNFSILSITIDYGPFRFMDDFNVNMVPNTSDDEGLYRYAWQPKIAGFNLGKMREALKPLLTAEQLRQTDLILDNFENEYQEEYLRIFQKKLGLCFSADLGRSSHNDLELIAKLLKMMGDQRADFTMSFRQLGEWPLQAMKQNILSNHQWALKQLSNHVDFNSWLEAYIVRILQCWEDDTQRQKAMNSVNPRYVLRNWIAQEAISAAERNEYELLEQIHSVLIHPFEEQEWAETAGYASPPPEWAREIRVSCSS